MKDRALNTEILSVGTELLLGHVTNTDARDVSEKKDPGPINTYHAFGRAKPRERLRVDYIYVSDGIRVRDFVTHDDKRPGTDRYPSDHYPLSATIEL